MAPDTEDVVYVAFPENGRGRRGGKDLTFPDLHVNIGKGRSKFFTHCGAFDLEEMLVSELKVIAEESNFE